MPLYVLFCDCGNSYETILKLEENLPECGKCGLQMKKAISAPAFILKGSRWASDNYGLKKETKKNG